MGSRGWGSREWWQSRGRGQGVVGSRGSGGHGSGGGLGWGSTGGGGQGVVRVKG